MKKESIKKHLKAYSIYNKRNSTINHAFASAIAPYDEYNEDILNEALKYLGQEKNDLLTCIFCDEIATGWDHLTGLVKDKQLRGFGHQIGNLVPCCGTCNSKKGSKEFDQFINGYTKVTKKTIKHIDGYDKIKKNKEELTNLLVGYQDKFAKKINLRFLEEKNPIDFQDYVDVKEEIFKLMKKADVIADKLRKHVL